MFITQLLLVLALLIPPTGDGAGLDPHGIRKAGWGIDPNGYQVNTDDGNGLDPHGRP